VADIARLCSGLLRACEGLPFRETGFKTRDEGTETASLIQFLLCRDRALARNPRNWGLTDESPENLVRV